MRVPGESGLSVVTTIEGATRMTAFVVSLQNLVARLREREGQTMAEYALIIGGIAIVVIAGILILGPAIRDLFQSTGSSVQTFPSS
jgi:Flp pilus assembly pilin Flp